MTFGDLPTDGQPHSRPLEFVPPMQTLEGREDAIGILLLEADPVVFHNELTGLTTTGLRSR